MVATWRQIPATENIEVMAGDYAAPSWTVTEDGIPIPWGTDTVEAAIYARRTSDDSLAPLDVNLAADGVLTVVLDDTLTGVTLRPGQYVWLSRIIRSGQPRTLISGHIEIIPKTLDA